MPDDEGGVDRLQYLQLPCGSGQVTVTLRYKTLKTFLTRIASKVYDAEMIRCLQKFRVSRLCLTIELS
jgi:hypothetical protein